MEMSFRSRWLRLTATVACLLGICLGLHGMLDGVDNEVTDYVVELGILKLLHWPTAWAIGEEPGFATWGGQLVVTSLLWGSGAGWVLARMNPFLRLSIGLAAFNVLGCAALAVILLSENLDSSTLETLPGPLLVTFGVVAIQVPLVLLTLPLGGQFLLRDFGGWNTEYWSPLGPLFGDNWLWLLFTHVVANALLWGLLVATAIHFIVRRRSALGLQNPRLLPVSRSCNSLSRA